MSLYYPKRRPKRTACSTVRRARGRHDRRFAIYLAHKLTTNGVGEVADRLVLVQDRAAGVGSTWMFRDLGGFSHGPLTNHIEEALRNARASGIRV